MKKRHFYFVSGWGGTEWVWGALMQQLCVLGKCTYLDWYTYVTDAPPIPCDPDAENIYVGWSLGGMILLKELTAQPISSVQRKLVLISSTARLVEDTDYPGISISTIQTMSHHLHKRSTAVVRNFFTQCAHTQESFTSLVTQANTLSISNLVNGLRYLEHTDLRSKLPNTTIPVLIIHGTQDTIIPLSQSQYMCEKIPKATLYTFQQATHDVLLHKVDDIAKTIISFVS